MDLGILANAIPKSPSTKNALRHFNVCDLEELEFFRRLMSLCRARNGLLVQKLNRTYDILNPRVLTTLIELVDREMEQIVRMQELWDIMLFRPLLRAVPSSGRGYSGISTPCLSGLIAEK